MLLFCFGYEMLIRKTLLFFTDYAPKKSCRQECSVSLSCQPGYVCESVGCNRMCRRLNTILPIEPIGPGFPGCVEECQSSVECGRNSVCVRQGCNRICQVRITDPVIPIGPLTPVLPGLGCRDECRRSIECGIGGVCIRRGCRRVCERGTIPTCLDQCTSSMDCQFNQVCARQGCRNICIRKPIINKY